MLDQLIAKLKDRGLMGVAIVDQRSQKEGEFYGPHYYVAIAVSKKAELSEPRSYDTHPTPEAAITDLLGRIS